MAVKRRHFTGCPGNSAFNASPRKESWGEARVARSNSEVLKQPWVTLINTSTTVAGEEKYDGCACPELSVQSLQWSFQEPAWQGDWAGGWEQSHPTGQGQGQGKQTAWAQLVLAQESGSGCWNTTFPLLSPCLSQGTTSQLWVLVAVMLPAAFWFRGRTPRWRN